MWQLVKRDFYILILLIVFAFMFRTIIGLLALFNSSNIFFFSFIFIMTYAYLFMQDRNSRVLQTIVSLPMKKSSIIISRYISIFVSGLIFIGVNFTIDVVIEQHAFHSLFIYIALIGLTMAIAISTPVYYFFKSVWASMLVQYGLLIFGILTIVFIFADPYDWFAPLIITTLNFIELQPYLIISGFLLILMALSIRFSIFLFKRKDIA